MGPVQREQNTVMKVESHTCPKVKGSPTFRFYNLREAGSEQTQMKAVRTIVIKILIRIGTEQRVSHQKKGHLIQNVTNGNGPEASRLETDIWFY